MGLKGTIIKSTAVIMSAALVTLTVPSVRYFAGADSIEEKQDQKQELKEANERLQEEIDALEADMADKQALAEKYEEKAANTKAMLDTVVAEIGQTEIKITEKEAEIAQKEVELQDAKALFEERLRAIYMTGSTSQIELLLSADNLTDYFVRSELVRNVTEADNALMESIKQKMTEIEAAKAEIEAQKAEAEERKKDLQALNIQYTEELEALNATISSIEDQTATLESEQEDNKEAMAQLDAEIAEAQRKAEEENNDLQFSNGNTGASASDGDVYASDMFTWPVPSCYTISSYYGTRWDRLHKGIDISKSGIYGSPIVAAADGVVIVNQYNSGGYGNYIMIDHGTSSDGVRYYTLYGHMSQPGIVSVGTHVSAGQVIGYVGSTGNSTGPHLHFEIHKNSRNNAVNPMNYFS